MAKGSNSFATFLILCPTCFFLGILFSSFPYDYPLLWTSLPPPSGYIPQLETHLSFIHRSPPIIPRILHIVIAVGLLGFFIKLYKPSEANVLFDGASLVLYTCGVVVYITNIVKGLRVVSLGLSDTELGQGEKTAVGALGKAGVADADAEAQGIGKEDGLRVLAASNTILALVLVGVLVLQAGQWYAERKDGEEREALEKEAKERRESGAAGVGGRSTSHGGGKKKQ
ncbi:MAG: hypothetical protein M1827_000668 [Pycnora praestabilis]|nr:MAG: hypothetical protein M1827_000668 [Pycnora praestabilis]